MTDQNFDAALDSFVAGCQAIVSKNDQRYENVSFNSRITAEPGRRYVRLVKTDDFGSGSCYCFVDKTNGDVLKAASWKAPAKHPRGNIFDSDNGLASMCPYGAAYMR